MDEPHQRKVSIEPLLVRVEEAAQILSLSRSMIYQPLERGELPSVRCRTAGRISLAALWVSVECLTTTILLLVPASTTSMDNVHTCPNSCSTRSLTQNEHRHID